MGKTESNDQDMPRQDSGGERADRMRPSWITGLKVYLGVSVGAHLVWETLQLPLYTLWTTGTTREVTFAVAHCTGGDTLIALAALMLGLAAAGHKNWPAESHHRVMLITLAVGIGYTIFSEWLNIVVRANWAYSGLMPVIPIIKTGLSPLLQWIVIPYFALSAARKAALRTPVGRHIAST